ncbi:MAG: HAMP domain-containing histidine kinase [Clostridia bacterium]|nr:HAMP domain-containing histidine kinase [Clostridia bacterium]
MRKSDKIGYKVALRRAKDSYIREKAAVKYAYKLEKSKLKYSLYKEISAEYPKPTEHRKTEVKAAIRRAKQNYKNRKTEYKLIYLQQKNEAKILLKKHKKWSQDAKTPTSLSFLLAVAFVLVFFVIVVLEGVFVLWTVRYMTDQQSDSQLSTVYSTLEAADFSKESAKSAAIRDIAFLSLVKEGAPYYIIGEEKVADLAHQKGEGIHRITVGVTNYRLLCEQTDYGTVYIAKSMQREDDFFALLLVVISVGAVLAAITSGVVGFSVSQKCLRPVHSMSRLMKEMTVSDLSARLDTNKIHTELRDMARYYNQMMDRLEASYGAQARFVSDASHELRTPLAVISGYADILQRWGKEDPAVLEEAIGSINDQCRRMNELLERLLTLSRMDNTLPEAHKTHQDLYPVLDEIARDFSLVAGDRDITVSAEKDISATFDAELLRQTLTIFLDNAVKFTATHGQIVLFATQEEDGLYVGVKDDGIGISADKLDKIFERFYKADPARGEKGYGLGLSIAASLAKAMDAAIKVDSTPDEGTTFTLVFEK